MPLRDHFRPPVSKQATWEGFHAGWPMVIVQQLRHLLPPGFIAEPRVHLGKFFEVDLGACETEKSPWSATGGGRGNGPATAVWAPARPAIDEETTLADEYEYEVRIYDADRERTLVAAIEFVSPENKDRPENRRIFVSKCASLLKQGVSVSIVDLVTVRQFNLYTDLLDLIDHTDPTLGTPAPYLYAATCRWIERDQKKRLQAWSNVLAVGQPLPTIPLWLREEEFVALDLEPGYERACNDLWIE